MIIWKTRPVHRFKDFYMCYSLDSSSVTGSIPAIELKDICKTFGLVEANKDISFRVNKGAIHGIIGENGAGKSTLMSILYGFYQADSGEIFIDGHEVKMNDSHAAIQAGIGMVFQHFKLVENFTVLENIILGVENHWRLAPSLANARKLLTELADEYELELDPDAKIEDLSVGQQQRVEILKALYRNADILILDEPTAVLTPAEADHLFRILKGLKNQGKTILLITHKLREVMEITESVSVMRKGQMVTTINTPETSPEGLAELMVGRKVLLQVEKTDATPAESVLDIENLKVMDNRSIERLKGISFSVRAGEIVGIAGVDGNGQSELLKALGGYAPATGTIKIKGQKIDLEGDAQSRRESGIAHVPEDRQSEGLVMDFKAWENVVLGYHNSALYKKMGVFMSARSMKRDINEKIERFDIRPPLEDLQTKYFSGGNQQKIVLAREIDRNPDLLVIAQPTRGVDVGAIEFIHQQILDLRDQGKAILLVSVELDEIISLSDRILVMFDGHIVGETNTDNIDEQELSCLMAGIQRH